MKKLIFLICFLTTLLSNAQTYDNVIISEKKNPDEDNQLFIPGMVFTYSLETSSEGFPDNVIYTVVNLPKSKRTNKRQTEVIISYSPNKMTYESTGIVENQDNIWLHPPRTDSMVVLETCPFPYAKFPLTEESKWEDQLSVGEQWSQGLWSGRMLFEIQYEVTGKVQFEIDNIFYDCWVIESKATSEVGTSSLKAIYHEDEGFMEFAYTTLKGQNLSLKLESTIQGPIYQKMDQYFADQLKSGK